MNIRSRLKVCHRAAGARKHRFRLDVELLEDRCVPSAGFGVVPIASDVPGLAPVTNPWLVNPWGMSFSPTGPFWLSEGGTGVSDLLDGAGIAIPLVVTVPGVGGSTGSPTGQVFNSGPGFVVSRNGMGGASQFLFATEDGTISGWAPSVDYTHAIIGVDNSAAGANYKGLAIATTDGHSLLYAADFACGKVDVFDEAFRPVARSGAFEDSAIPAGFAPFNIQELGGALYVTYAKQDASRFDDVPGAGLGYVDVYDASGNLLRRLASGGALNAPWGLALAPNDFEPYGGALLVGNAGDGRISAFSPASGAYLGQLADDAGQPIVLPRLWGIMFGNGYMGGDDDTLFFTAGIGDEAHGLFGAIQAPRFRGRGTAGSGIFDPNVPGERADYPLPPSGNGVLPGGNNRTIAVSVLLPLSQSSLALAPTLQTFTQPGSGDAAAPPASPFITAALNRSAPSTVVASAAYVPQETQQPDSALPMLALGSFLDLGSARAVAPDAESNSPSGTAIALAFTPPFAPPETHAEVQPRRIIPVVAAGPSIPRNGAPLAQAEGEAIEAIALSGSSSSVSAQGASHKNAGVGDAWTALFAGAIGALGLSVAWGRAFMSREKCNLAKANRESMKTQVTPAP